jgi:hypothetical protein
MRLASDETLQAIERVDASLVDDIEVTRSGDVAATDMPLA